MQGFKPFSARFEQHLMYKGEQITCNDGHSQRTGICHSINDDGTLNLLLPSGQTITLSSGEIYHS
jgi:biotin-(acetyl-CoA carboxylase) ligase